MSIVVSVKAEYIPGQSRPQQQQYVFAYTITLVNRGDTTAQLISRYWHITDSHGEVQEVQGEGVVGEQPKLAPGQSYSYTSGVVLKTSSGTMRGSYLMRTANKEEFEAEIPMFALVQPQSLH